MIGNRARLRASLCAVALMVLLGTPAARAADAPTVAASPTPSVAASPTPSSGAAESYPRHRAWNDPAPPAAAASPAPAAAAPMVAASPVPAASPAAGAASPSAATATSRAGSSAQSSQTSTAAKPPASIPAALDGAQNHATKDHTALDGAHAVALKRAGRETAGAQALDWLGPLPKMTPGEQELNVTADDSYLDPINWSLTVYKSRHRVELYYKGRMFKTYHAVFGYHDRGAKRWEGDLRTPEGVYTIIGKYTNPRWKYFLRLNYPNYVDRRNYESMLHDHVVPVVHGQHPDVGGAVGIHGTDRPRFNRDDINWTRGCISVDNDAIVELNHFVPVDTLVVIKP